MKIGTFAIAAGVTALGLATWMTPGKAQGPLYDRVNVNLPYTVTIGDRTLQPGDYVIQQYRDTAGGSRVLLIYSDNGMKFETSAMTIPTLDQNTARDTKVSPSSFRIRLLFRQGLDPGQGLRLRVSCAGQREGRARRSGG